LINTGWTGGSYGEGQRFPLLITRQIVRTIQKNVLNITPFDRDEIFGFDIPHAVRKVPTSFLHPKEGWSDKVAYDKKAKELAESFHKQMKNFGSFYTDNLQGSPIYGR
jgi:phosphoenolpyruvate carboxykinase (ATP)